MKLEYSLWIYMIKNSEALKVVYDLLAIIETASNDLSICYKMVNKINFGEEHLLDRSLLVLKA